MKVLFINNISIGGTEKALKEIASEMKAAGAEMTVCTSVEDSMNDFLNKNGIENTAAGYEPVMYIPTNIKWRRPLSIAKHFIQHRVSLKKAMRVIESKLDMKSFDIIHTNINRIDIGCELSRKYGIPHVMHLREFSGGHFDLYTLRKEYYRYLNENCDVFLAASDAALRDWTEKGLDPKKCRTLYDGVDFGDFKTKSENSYDGDTLKIVIVSRIYKAKGQLTAVRALNMLDEDIKKNTTLDLIGAEEPLEAGYISEIKNEITCGGLSDRVRFTGEKNNIGELLRDYDVGITCSRSEGFGRVTAEYMYAGLGTIVTDTGASPELVEDGKSGLVFGQDDPAALAKCIERFYNDRAFLRQCGKNAHERAAERFGSKRNAENILAVYNELLKN